MEKHRPLHSLVVLISQVLDLTEDAALGLISQAGWISQKVNELLLLLGLAPLVDLNEGCLQLPVLVLEVGLKVDLLHALGHNALGKTLLNLL